MIWWLLGIVLLALIVWWVYSLGKAAKEGDVEVHPLWWMGFKNK